MASDNPATSSRPITFFVLVFVLTIPFWIAGASGRQIMPGLPVSALAVVCPLIAPGALTYWEQGARATVALLFRAFDWRRIRPAIWYIPILFAMPAIYLTAYIAMRAWGTALPQPNFPSALSILSLLLLFAVAAQAEEIGWSGYSLEPMQRRFGALGAALIIGAVWAAWHFVALAEVHRSVMWIAGWTIATIATRVIMVALYYRAGQSVFAVALLHAGNNLCWQLFPNRGSHYDPRVTGAILAIIAIGIVVSGALTPKQRSSRHEPAKDDVT